MSEEHSHEPRKFVVEFLDPATECIRSESVLEVTDVTELSAIVDPDLQDIHPSAVYELEPDKLSQLVERFGIVADDISGPARLRGWRPLDELPYEIHTNRELGLMLAGKKPLAVFSDSYPSNPDFKVIPEEQFEPFVTAGKLVKRECILPGRNGRQIRYVLYAQGCWRRPKIDPPTAIVPIQI